MKVLIKALLVGVLVSAVTAPALAYTISGVIPSGPNPVRINFRRPIRPTLMRFTFIAPRRNAGVAYELGFCVGAPANPCGLPTSRTTNVPMGQSRTVTYNSSLFISNILVVGQGTNVALPYMVRVN
jgi:hypothetical protein